MTQIPQKIVRRIVEAEERRERDAEDQASREALASLSRFDPNPPELQKLRAEIGTLTSKVEQARAAYVAAQAKLTVPAIKARDLQNALDRERRELWRRGLCVWRRDAALARLMALEESSRWDSSLVSRGLSKAIGILQRAAQELTAIGDSLPPLPEPEAYDAFADRVIAEFHAALEHAMAEHDAAVEAHTRQQEARRRSLFQPSKDFAAL